MNFYTTRDLRTTPKSIWEDLASDGEVVITNNGRPKAILVDISDGSFEETIKAIKQAQSNCVIVGYSPDNMAERHNQSQVFLESFRYYDIYITTKSYTVDTLRKMGCENILFVNNAYEETFHHPYTLTEEEREQLGGKVGFIGAWEEERCHSCNKEGRNLCSPEGE